MFDTVLGYLTNSVVVGAIALVVGVVFSQKIKDWIEGIPPDLRASLSAVKTQAKADLKVAAADVVAKYNPVKVKAPVAPPAPPAPVVTATVTAPSTVAPPAA